MSLSRESFTSLPGGLALLVEVEHLENIRALPGQLLVADRVDVQLVAGDVLGLGALGRLEVDDRRLAGVQLGDQVDPAVDRDPGRDVDLDLLLGVEGVLQPGPVLRDVPPDRADRGPPQVRAERGVRERRVQVPIDQLFRVKVRRRCRRRCARLCTSAITSCTDLP